MTKRLTDVERRYDQHGFGATYNWLREKYGLAPEGHDEIGAIVRRMQIDWLLELRGGLRRSRARERAEAKEKARWGGKPWKAEYYKLLRKIRDTPTKLQKLMALAAENSGATPAERAAAEAAIARLRAKQI